MFLLGIPGLVGTVFFLDLRRGHHTLQKSKHCIDGRASDDNVEMGAGEEGAGKGGGCVITTTQSGGNRERCVMIPTDRLWSEAVCSRAFQCGLPSFGDDLHLTWWGDKTHHEIFFCCARAGLCLGHRWLGLLPIYICSLADNNPRTGGPQQLWGRVVGASRVVALPICRDPVVE
jgi:hypothetical protein